MIIQERLTFGQTYVVQSDGPIKITQTGAHGTLEKVNVTDEAGTAGREVVFTAIDTAATVEVDEGTNWSCVPGFNRGAASVQGGPAELPTDQKTFLQWVTDGKLTFDADGRLKIATSVDATGTFNHDGYASNYTKTVDGVKYTTTVNANEVIVKKSVAGVETVLMHLHDGVLELNGAPALTQETVTLEPFADVGVAPRTLRHMGLYTAYVDAATGFDFGDLTVPAGATVRLRVYVSGSGSGQQVWAPTTEPDRYYWIGTASPQTAPVLTEDRCWNVVLENDGTRTVAHVAYDYPLP